MMTEAVQMLIPGQVGEGQGEGSRPGSLGVTPLHAQWAGCAGCWARGAGSIKAKIHRLSSRAQLLGSRHLSDTGRAPLSHHSGEQGRELTCGLEHPIEHLAISQGPRSQ